MRFISSSRNGVAFEALTAGAVLVWIYRAGAMLLDKEASADFSQIGYAIYHEPLFKSLLRIELCFFLYNG